MTMLKKIARERAMPEPQKDYIDIAKMPSGEVFYFDFTKTIPEHQKDSEEVLGYMHRNDAQLDALLKSDDATLQRDQLTFSELLTQLRANLTQLESLIAKNPELEAVRMVSFNPTTTVLKSVREAVWGIFNATGKFIGRNSAEAVLADTRVWVASQGHIFQEYKGEPELFIVERLKPIADIDIASSLGNAQVFYHRDDSKLMAFYKTLANLRRRSNTDKAKRAPLTDIKLTARPLVRRVQGHNPN